MIWVSIREQKLFAAWPLPEAPGPLAGALVWKVIDDWRVGCFVCSTSAAEPSQVDGSLGTPLGLHAVADRIGESAPLGAEFRGRVPVGATQLPAEPHEPNRITTRILRLRGLEPGWNAGEVSLGDLPPREVVRAGICGPDEVVSVDSYRRYIYLHGTNHERKLGTPFSAGCVLLGNLTIAELFPAIPTGTPVLIE